MKKFSLTIMFVFAIVIVKAQSYKGFLSDNYSGVNSVINNPANIVDSRFKVDVNLIGASYLFGNDYYGVDYRSLVEGGEFDFGSNGKTFPKEDNMLSGNVDIMGPSFMFNIDSKNSLAVFSRARGFFNLFDVNGESLDAEGGFNENESFSINEGDFNGALNVWSEYGISYARVFYNEKQHFLKGGISVKYLRGMGNAYVSGKDVTVDYDEATGVLSTDGQVVYGYSRNFTNNTNVKFRDKVKGYGADLGMVYEWRPDYADYNSVDAKGIVSQDKTANKYKLKFGLSITDIGSIRDKNKGVQETYDLSNPGEIDKSDLDGQNFREALQNNYTLVAATVSDNHIKLPTALHFNTDWSINKNLYLNLNVDQPLTSKTRKNANRVYREISLSPRFESKWFSFYSPVRLVERIGFQWGAGLRAGPLYVGSSSVFSNLLAETSKAADVYMGLKVPIYQSQPKDKDGDGVINKLDDCPNIAGPIDNNGCPWPDTDKDGVFDKDDNCPEKVGPKENNGCPWPDTDGDGLLDKDDACPKQVGTIENKGCPDTDGDGIVDKDDRCPNIAGTVANNGCPDTDGDTVVDIDDACPNVAGSVSNNGCPEVTEEVQKQLNSYARTILFDSGKSSIKAESTIVMVDIIQILTEYPNAKFMVEGHTDSVGSAVNNQKLSEARANSVRNFLISNGITAKRLSAIGYGEEKPIASNKASSGRKQNRRVEINLIK